MRLQQLTDRKNQITTYSYDELDRLTLLTYADQSTTAYTYDAGDRLTQIVDDLGALEFELDPEMMRRLNGANPLGGFVGPLIGGGLMGREAASAAGQQLTRALLGVSEGAPMCTLFAATSDVSWRRPLPTGNFNSTQA